MNGSSRVLTLLALGFACMASLANGSSLPPSCSDEAGGERVEFEHIGPQDAALPVLTIAVGAPAASARDLVLVTPPLFVALQAALRRAPQTGGSPVLFGTFEVRSHACGGAMERYVVGPQTFLGLLLPLHQAFSAQHPLPDSMARLETMVSGSMRR